MLDVGAVGCAEVVGGMVGCVEVVGLGEGLELDLVGVLVGCSVDCSIVDTLEAVVMSTEELIESSTEEFIGIALALTLAEADIFICPLTHPIRTRISEKLLTYILHLLLSSANTIAQLCLVRTNSTQLTAS